MQYSASLRFGDTFASMAQPNSILAILHTSVSKVIKFIEERMPIANSLRRTINWSDGCISQFKSWLVLLNYFQPNEDIESTTMNHIMVGKRDMDDIGGTTKNQVFRESKS